MLGWIIVAVILVVAAPFIVMAGVSTLALIFSPFIDQLNRLGRWQDERKRRRSK